MAKILFAVDKVSRDIPIYRLLGRGLADSGHEVTLEYQDFVWTKYVLNWKKCFKLFDVIIVPSLNICRDPTPLLRAVLNRAHIVHFPSEQYFQPVAYKDKFSIDCSVSGSVTAALFLYSPYNLKGWVELGGVPEYRTHVIGNPKSALYTSGSSRLTDARRVVLVSDFKAGTTDTFIQDQHFGYAEDLEKKRYYRDMANLFCLIANELAAAGRPVTMRLHPGEAEDFYLSRLSGNVEISLREPLPTCIGSASIVLQCTSSSYFETSAAGVPVFCISNGQMPSSIKRDYFSCYPWVAAPFLSSFLPELQSGEALAFVASEEFEINVNGDIVGPKDPERRFVEQIESLIMSPAPRYKSLHKLIAAGAVILLVAKQFVALLCRFLPGLDNCDWCERVRRSEYRFHEGEDYMVGDIRL